MPILMCMLIRRQMPIIYGDAYDLYRYGYTGLGLRGLIRAVLFVDELVARSHKGEVCDISAEWVLR